MSLARKHYQAAAIECNAWFLQWQSGIAKDGRRSVPYGVVSRRMYLAVRGSFIRFFRADNIAFDEERFIAACEKK